MSGAATATEQERRTSDLLSILDHPLKLAKFLWPSSEFYAKQVEVIESLRDNEETIIVAGNKLGKDYTAGCLCVMFFLAPHLFFPKSYVDKVNRFCGKYRIPKRRVVTTSVKDDHLRVLWGEIGGFITSSTIPLLIEGGGPLILLNKEIRLASEKEARNPESYMIGCVSEKGEGMAGHHADYNLVVIDEASGVDDLVYTQASTWAKKKLIFGNPNPCRNFFYKSVKGGNLATPY